MPINQEEVLIKYIPLLVVGLQVWKIYIKMFLECVSYRSIFNNMTQKQNSQCSKYLVTLILNFALIKPLQNYYLLP